MSSLAHTVAASAIAVWAKRKLISGAASKSLTPTISLNAVTMEETLSKM
jgi:hypothetical protein